ncbi:MAG TPA: UDP-N-acetylglucosamine 2-epimerase (non-hydrolyzing) [Synergistaceae bacterium]|nr:UDP-N-acetylglucosamine 2-epimerase (non-hydrolyzing) [Synergistaceae bacterium]
MKNITCIVGTRPEAIKMAPVILALRDDRFRVTVLSTGQHSHMLHQALSTFRITADIDLSIMQERQTLDAVTAKVLQGVGYFLDRAEQDLVLVHGDTTTTMAATLACFYRHVPVGHVEAGLRSHDLDHPFPEEANRIITDRLSTLWFAPTERAAENLRREGLPVTENSLFITGNTVIDALQATIKQKREPSAHLQRAMRHQGPLVLMTAHRRESWGKPLESICHAIGDILEARADLQVLIPMHKNPSVRETIQAILGQDGRVTLCEPLDYPDFIWAMNRCDLILSDSGGVQEEAAGLKKPLLVMRNISERPEAMEQGTAELVGTSRERIREAALAILSDESYRERLLNRGANPFGDGSASKRIVQGIRRYYERR